MKILILGAGGMLGFALHRILTDAGWHVTGAVRDAEAPGSHWAHGLRYLTQVDAAKMDSVMNAIEGIQATVVINAIGLKTAKTEEEIKRIFAINAVFPRRLALVTKQLGARLVHFSSDGVYNSGPAPFNEGRIPNADDYYGASKYLGESTDDNILILRTSIIGRSLNGQRSLVDWLLSQSGEIKGYRKAIFTGFPVNEIGAIFSEHILPKIESIHGLYHLASSPISKADVLELVRQAWGLDHIRIQPDDSVVIDRSLNSERLMGLINYRPPAWPELVGRMHEFYENLEHKGFSS